MSGKDLPDTDHVVRYVKSRDLLEDGNLNCSAFQLRPGESGLSVNWIEYFKNLTKLEQIHEIRGLIRLSMRPSGRLAELNVGQTRRHVDYALGFVHSPLPAEDVYAADPSHSEVIGLPAGDSAEAELIGDMIAECVVAVHPAVEHAAQ